LRSSTRSSTDKPHPDSRCGEFDESEIVGVVFFKARRDRPEVFELAEEALDEIAKAIEVRTEGGSVEGLGIG